MNTEWLETFLCIAQTGAVSVAARTLYLSQSTVSARLAALEEELGYPLVERARGKRQTELTPEGYRFISIARNMVELKNAALGGREESIRVRIAGVYSLNDSLLPVFYGRLLKNRPHFRCHLRSVRSEDMYLMLEGRECDFCFGTVLQNRREIRVKELFSQKMVVIMKSRNPQETQTIHPHDLDPEKEIQLHAENELVQWHDYWWKTTQRIRVDSPSLLEKMLLQQEEDGEEGFWALVPLSIVSSLPYPVQVYELSAAPPERICYLLERTGPYPGNMREQFLEELEAFVRDETIQNRFGLKILLDK
ncbi:MAG: LysR family transcriptional regulator [Lachnospiraceae bacterium]|nr:LysR family transcriptional regulator [Lachnospiraceae bacterium]